MTNTAKTVTRKEFVREYAKAIEALEDYCEDLGLKYDTVYFTNKDKSKTDLQINWKAMGSVEFEVASAFAAAMQEAVMIADAFKYNGYEIVG